VFSQSFETPVRLSANEPLTATGRVTWALESTFGPTSILSISTQSALKTWSNSPREYGPHWDGFGKRIASGIAVSGVSDAVEASVGALWGEDPRYRRQGQGSAGARLKYVVKMAFMADRASGDARPAYARFIAIPSSQIISNAWRPPSEVGVGDTTLRIGLSFARQIGGNAFSEFWPDLRRKITRRGVAGKSSSD